MSAVSAELLKVRTTKAWWGIGIGLVVWVAVWSLPAAFTSGMDLGGGQVLPGPEDDATARSLYTQGLTTLGYVFTLVLGILVLSTEYRHKTITSTLLASPRRTGLVLSKWVVTGVYSLGYGAVALSASFLVIVGILSLRGVELNLGAEGLARSMALALLAFVLWGLIGVGIGTMVGNQIVAILVGLGFIFVEFIAQFGLLFVSWGPDLIKWLPSAATNAMLQPSVETGPGLQDLAVLPWWLALIVLVGYAAVTAGIGAALTLRRDVT